SATYRRKVGRRSVPFADRVVRRFTGEATGQGGGNEARVIETAQGAVAREKQGGHVPEGFGGEHRHSRRLRTDHAAYFWSGLLARPPRGVSGRGAGQAGVGGQPARPIGSSYRTSISGACC